MKKRVCLSLLIALVFAAALSALAELDALELTTADVVLNLAGVQNPKNLTDRKYTTNSETKSVKNPTLTVSSSTPIYGLYLCFSKKPEEYEIQVKRDGSWETLRDGSEYYHAFYSLDGVTDVRVYARGRQEAGDGLQRGLRLRGRQNSRLGAAVGANPGEKRYSLCRGPSGRGAAVPGRRDSLLRRGAGADGGGGLYELREYDPAQRAAERAVVHGIPELSGDRGVQDRQGQGREGGV